MFPTSIEDLDPESATPTRKKDQGRRFLLSASLMKAEPRTEGGKSLLTKLKEEIRKHSLEPMD